MYMLKFSSLKDAGKTTSTKSFLQYVLQMKKAGETRAALLVRTVT